MPQIWDLHPQQRSTQWPKHRVQLTEQSRAAEVRNKCCSGSDSRAAFFQAVRLLIKSSCHM